MSRRKKSSNGKRREPPINWPTGSDNADLRTARRRRPVAIQYGSMSLTEAMMAAKKHR